MPRELRFSFQALLQEMQSICGRETEQIVENMKKELRNRKVVIARTLLRLSHF